MRVRFLAVALEELRDAIRYYDTQRGDLSGEFRDEVRIGVERLRSHPLAWRPLSDNTRQMRLSRFPYALIYRVRRDEILVVAVAHLHREPQYWVERVTSL